MVGWGWVVFGLQIIFINTKNIYKSECFIYTQEFVESFAQVMCIFSIYQNTHLQDYDYPTYLLRDISL